MQPTRDEIIKHFTDNINAFQRYARNIAGKEADDLFQEVSLMILECDEDRLQSYWNEKDGLKPIFLRLLVNQYKSNTSKYHKEYRKLNDFVQTKGEDVVYNAHRLEDVPDFTPEEVKYITWLRNNMHLMHGQMFPNDIEDLVFAIYEKTQSLRKTLDVISGDHKELFDLKTVHEIIKKYRRTIKKKLNKSV